MPHYIRPRLRNYKRSYSFNPQSRFPDHSVESTGRLHRLNGVLSRTSKTLTPSGEKLRCATPPPLIAICRPYLEPTRFARLNFSVEITFYLAQFELIINFVKFYHERSISKKKQLRKVHIFVVLFKARLNLLKNEFFSATLQTQGNILNEIYSQVGSQIWISDQFCMKV